MSIRWLSLWLRRRNAQQECRRTLRDFDAWRELQRQLHVPRPHPGTVLIIRLDDIGDYLLFRNQLRMYRKSPRWASHKITLLANTSWQEIFSAFDADGVDEVLWVNKGEYLVSAPYRLSIWAQLRDLGFETVIAPSRTRPLLLDDLCRLAAAPLHSIGSANTYAHATWNRLSDGLYDSLFASPDTRVHEFVFNGQFAAWICGDRFAGSRPELDVGIEPKAAAASTEVICFVGANTRSRRWPAKRWIEFINLHRKRYPAGTIILAGNGTVEQELAARIRADTVAESIAGRISLLDLARQVAGARAVISNDTMAAHLGVSCGRPTVIIANGVNYERFTDYAGAGISGVTTLYPRTFMRKRKRDPGLLYHYTDALTADIATIAAGEVLKAVDQAVMSLPLRQGI